MAARNPRAKRPRRATRSSFEKFAASVEAGRLRLARSRRMLAARSRPGDPAVVVRGPYMALARAMNHHQPKLMARQGVLGLGLGTRRKNGIDTGEPRVVVFVRKRRTPSALRRSGQPLLPRRLPMGTKSAPVDVIQLGRLKLLHGPGGSIGPQDRAIKGTIGSVAVADPGGRRVALTAMHVCDAERYPDGARPAIPMFVPSRLDDLGAPLVGHVEMGTRDDTDAARIGLLSPKDFANELPYGGRIQGWRPVVYPGDQDIPVQLYGANSGYRLGTLRYVGVDLPRFRLRRAMLVEIECRQGDSGSGLMDMQGFILGFLVGEMEGTSPTLHIFTPAGLVLARLKCDIPTIEEI